ncbi:DUF2177 family protein [Roseateles asaccharophilus]|uniref:Membrane protein n=2 Tax=Roseateles asaccharophilus TaxID=582607 RepID=A0ABU2A8L2_9BURK|nr:DUF2177 family protein [Roseateles asaccharophilus]MDR7333475.1 putative membrane protein [Roseateles asaccharophilus]
MLKPYLTALLVLGVLDGLWLGWLMRGFYRRHIGQQMAERLRWRPALLFYLSYPAALIVLALLPAGQPPALQVARAALVGLVAYGVYDLTNRATLRHWPPKLALVDVAWGTFASTAAGAAAVWVAQGVG